MLVLFHFSFDCLKIHPREDRYLGKVQTYICLPHVTLDM